MLKVTIELFPFGSTHNRKTLDELYIVNKGPVGDACPGEAEVVNYHVFHNDRPTSSNAKPDAKTIHCRGAGALLLVAESILDLLGYDYSMSKRRKLPRPKRKKK